MRIFALFCLAATLLAQSPADIERGLRPPVQIEGRPEVRWTLAERMAHLKVPAVSVAVIEGGKIVWAQAWGATPDTLFQAASISKPVAAIAALKLVEQGRLSLDEDVNAKLKSWKVPPSAAANGKPVTLRRLLSHSAGLTVHGFPGYAQGASTPALQQILDGTPPANTKPILVDLEPGTKFRYSGGGYTVMQQLVEDVTGKPFASVLKELVLTPAAMKSSTYEQPLPAPLHSKAARGHDAGGEPVPGGWHTYPEQAAAGLWTTPSDLARLLLTVPANKLLSPATTEAMLTAQHGNYALGWNLRGKEDRLAFDHGGANAGFQCYAIAYRHRGQGAVVMTNSDNGFRLYNEILRAIAAHYQWPDYLTQVKRLMPMSPEKLANYAGEYEGGNMKIEMRVDGEGLAVLTQGRNSGELRPESETAFFSLSGGIPNITFERDADGKVTGFRSGAFVTKKIR